MGTSIHFPATGEPDHRRKVLKLRVDSAPEDIRRCVQALSSLELRGLLGVPSYDELRLKAQAKNQTIHAHALFLLAKQIRINDSTQPDMLNGRAGTYSAGRGDFFHDLFPYLEAFSPQFVSTLLGRYAPHAKVVLDPFGGCGTTPFTFTSSHESGRFAYYCEVNPVLQRVVWLKEQLRSLPETRRAQLKALILSLTSTIREDISALEPDGLLAVTYRSVFEGSQIFSCYALDRVLRLRTYIYRVHASDKPLGDALEIAALSALIPASNMQRAGDLRRKRPNERARSSEDIIDHLVSALEKIAEGIGCFDAVDNRSILLASDARLLKDLPLVNADAIVTSPPYLNGTNYFRNTKIELWFLGVLKNSSDLGILRGRGITAGINDVRGVRSKTDPDNIEFPSLVEALETLDECAYDRRIPKMVRWYAHDLNNALSGSIEHLRIGGLIAVDIGDSVYSGVKVPTDDIVRDILKNNGCSIEEELLVRERMSRSGQRVRQLCLVARKKKKRKTTRKSADIANNIKWTEFKSDLPHLTGDHKKRNWGHSWHSLCSFQGKLKPSIAHFLVEAFVPPGGKLLDPFSGVGTIPFEGALAGRTTYAFDLSPAAVAISRAKLTAPSRDEVEGCLRELDNYIQKNVPKQGRPDWLPSFNRPLADYYHEKTLKEILAAREWFATQHPWEGAVSFLLASTMHVLHGNRPYALSRRSHPVTPFAPTGITIYKSLVEKVREKVDRAFKASLPEEFVPGLVFETDATRYWPAEVDSLDAIVTSPPFFDSTRFFLANWIRLWFAGWNEFDFKNGSREFLESRQTQSFACYDDLLRQSRERLKPGGCVLLHLGKSTKCDMAKQIAARSRRWFGQAETFVESVGHCESHGIRDKGTVTDHQYLLLY